MNYTKEQLEKLPRWAQTEIKTLSQNVASLQERLNEFKGEGETNTFIRWGLQKTPIPNNSQIEFQSGDRNLNTVSVYIKANGDIDVNTDSRLGHTMVIMPRAANSFYITFVDYN